MDNIARATKAGKASGRKRRVETRERDRILTYAYAFLLGLDQDKVKNRLGMQFLEDNGINLDDECTSPVKVLSECSGLSTRRIGQILKTFKVGEDRKNRDELNMLKNVSERLRLAREANGYTTGQAAKRLGLSVVKLKEYESGIDINSIPLGFVKSACVVYKVSADYVLGIVNDCDDDELTNDQRLSDFIISENERIINDVVYKATRS